MKKFVGIFFSNKQWCVVPNTWLVEKNDKKFVMWPTRGDVTLLAQQETEPDRKWQMFPYAFVGCSSGEKIYM